MTPAFIERPCRDLQRSVAWYSALLGCDPTLADETNHFVHYAMADFGVALKQSGFPSGDLLYFQVPSLDQSLARLASQGIHPVGETKASAEGYRRALFRDPDGGRVGLFESIAEPSPG